MAFVPRKVDQEFFKFVKPIPFLLTGVVWLFLGLGCFNPSLFPHEMLGPIGKLYRYMVFDNPMYVFRAFYGLLIVHFLESVYALDLTHKKGVKNQSAQIMWFVQTMIFGYFSWKSLAKFEPKSAE